ncbi:hypothetical protein F0562_003796 [Nyssa sinensis]|uniref:Uncharacterized protein n=1 Tax=Nyssa sinensis TaxID=561372 RepID=A0A5J5BZK1_9ASTE|nr:hypothetical protein F0562_003796 [Nyssa sinensis]
MKDDDALPISTPTTHTATTTIPKKETLDSTLLGRGRYKFWALAAILLLAFWSMLTGTVTLRWSAGNLNHISDDIDTPIRDDLDVLVCLKSSLCLYIICSYIHIYIYIFYFFVDLVLMGWNSGRGQEMEESEKVVKHMWDVYTNSHRIRLPRFWQEAFEAAYEDLTSDVSGVREAAISEIAKMSMRSIDLQPPPLQSTSVQELSLKQAEKGKKELTSGESRL